MSLRRIVRNLPSPVQRAIRHGYGAIPPRLKYGSVFWRTRKLLEESQQWSLQQLQHHQDEQIEDLIQYSVKNVPYYRVLFASHGLQPQDIQHSTDLAKLPLLTRQDVRENLSALVAEGLPARRREHVTTGGSTGVPLAFYYERPVSREAEHAFMSTMWERVGFRLGDRRVMLRGDVVVGGSRKWEIDPAHRTLALSSYHLDEPNLDTFVEQIRNYKPHFLHVYPSAGTILAKYLLGHGIAPFPGLKAVLCSSEPLHPWQRELMAKAFGCRVFSWYGLTEQGALAGECEAGYQYHVFPEYGVVELIKNDVVVTQPGVVGEIVVTGFFNRACPFIRYRTGDLASWSSDEPCDCGRAYPRLERIEGRQQDFVVTADGRRITLTALIFGQHFEAFARIRAMQLVQRVPGYIEVRIVQDDGYGEDDEGEIRAKIQVAVGEGLDVSFSYPDDIERTSRGKHQFLIQDVPLLQ
jgi:phenylacetate-coenzyme A ligase PaaK-like adenylate-forming protein